MDATELRQMREKELYDAWRKASHMAQFAAGLEDISPGYVDDVKRNLRAARKAYFDFKYPDRVLAYDNADSAN